MKEQTSHSFVDLNAIAASYLSNHADDETQRGGGLDNPRRPQQENKADDKNEEPRSKPLGRGEPD